MRKLATLAAALLILTAFNKIQAQMPAKQTIDNLYWFNIRIDKMVDKDSKRIFLHINKLFTKIQSGSFNEFAESYKKNLLKNNLCMGPYPSRDLAQYARDCYQVGRLTYNEAIDKVGQLKSSNKLYYFYFTEPLIPEKTKDLAFARIPARVGFGSNKEFLDIFLEGLTHQKLAIGPFDNLLIAEKSKYISRKYGELQIKGNETESKASPELKQMAENWNITKILLKEIRFNEKNDSVTCKLNINFVPEYFNKKVMQVIMLDYSIDNSTISLPIGFTFQGLEVEDNNPVVSIKDGRNFEFSVSIPYAAEKSTSLIIKSTLFSYTDMLNCDDIILEIKTDGSNQ